MHKNLHHLVKKLKKNIQMPFYLRPFRKRVEKAIDTLAQTQAGKDLLMHIGDVPKEINIRLLSSNDAGSYNGSTKKLTLNGVLLKKSEKENLVCTMGHELFHKMLYDQKMGLYKKKMSPSQIITLEILNEASATAFEKALLMETFPEKARQDRDLSVAFQIFEKTKKENGLQTAHKKTQAFLVKALLTEELLPVRYFDWLGSYLHLACLYTKFSFVHDGDRVSYEGNHKSYQTILNRYTQMYHPFLKVTDLDRDIISSDEDVEKDVQQFTDAIRRFKTERPKGVPDTKQTRIQAIIRTRGLDRI